MERYGRPAGARAAGDRIGEPGGGDRGARLTAKARKMGWEARIAKANAEAIRRRDSGEESLAEIGRSYNVSGWTISRLHLMTNLPKHTYEEVRQAVMDVLLNPTTVGGIADSFDLLLPKVAVIFSRNSNPGAAPQLHNDDAELVRDVFWDLFRQGFITLGKDSSWNAGWPWFRLSRFGAKALQNQSPYRFHDTTSYLAIVKKEVPDILDVTVTYLEEAVAALYADCLLASCVMLGVAAEAEFLRLVEVATTSRTHGATFAPILKAIFIRSKITKFHAALKPLVPTLQPKKDFEDLDTNLTLIHSVLRIARNDAGHPTATPTLEREQVYIYLQMFVPFARQVMRLRTALI